MKTDASPARTSPVIFGEVLFDCFPDGKRVLGGAPFNVAWHLRGFGLNPRFVSAVGTDDDGDAILDAMRDWGMNTDYVARDPSHGTGRVEVSLENGSPSYEILRDRAWDFITADDSIFAGAPLLYHGSLASRSLVSAETLQKLRANLDAPTFVDLNIRPPDFDIVWLPTLIDGCAWIKLNDEELAQLQGIETPALNQLEAPARQFCKQYSITNGLVTAGADGALICNDTAIEKLSPAPAPESFQDSVGAGDSFAAVTLYGILNNWDARTILQRAAAFASKVCGLQGATTSDTSFYKQTLKNWH